MPSPFGPPPNAAAHSGGSSSHYSSSLLNNSASAAAAALNSANKFNTIHSSVNKRGGVGVGGGGTPNHYESAAGAGVVGGAGLKDYTRIGEGGGALLALRERDYHTNNQVRRSQKYVA